MASGIDRGLRDELLNRRKRLVSAPPQAAEGADIRRLLDEVDAALGRIDTGAFGLCETCHDPIEPARLMANPLLRFCLDHLTPHEQRAFEEDLQLAARIQAGLLPPRLTSRDGWEAGYHYRPAGAVSGDYCDIVIPADRDSELLFFLGDVAGKGIAAAMLMSQLHAMFRTLAGFNLPLGDLLHRANRLFCDSTPASHFATLVCIRARSNGAVEVANAGHCPVLFLGAGGTRVLEPANLPLGLFCEGRYAVTEMQLSAGDSLFLYTDGLTEACDAAGEDYGLDRVKTSMAACRSLPAQALVESSVRDLERFIGNAALSDDLTAMAIRRQ